MMKIKNIEQPIVPETGWICLESVGIKFVENSASEQRKRSSIHNREKIDTHEKESEL
jgi:hypothetical protein